MIHLVKPRLGKRIVFQDLSNVEGAMELVWVCLGVLDHTLALWCTLTTGYDGHADRPLISWEHCYTQKLCEKASIAIEAE